MNISRCVSISRECTEIDSYKSTLANVRGELSGTDFMHILSSGTVMTRAIFHKDRTLVASRRYGRGYYAETTYDHYWREIP